MRGTRPEIEFSAEKTRIEAGESTTVRWQTDGVNEVTFWKNTDLPNAPEPLDWMYIFRRGEGVGPSGHKDLSPTITTACYLVARGPRGISGKRIVIDVVKEADKSGKEPALIWKPPSKALGLIAEHPHVALLDRRLYRSLQAGWEKTDPLKPEITLRISPEVAFGSEPVTQTWEVLYTNCAKRETFYSHTYLIPASGSTSGTEIAGSTNEMVEDEGRCGLEELSGSSSKVYTDPGHHSISIQASTPNPFNPFFWDMVIVAWRLWVLPEPRINVTASTVSAEILTNKIRDAIKYIIVRIFPPHLAGFGWTQTCIVDAFARGYIHPVEFCGRVCAEIENLNLITFIIEDAEVANGYWEDYTNNIYLKWTPRLWVEYVIIHELIHKCGFNVDLKRKYKNDGYSEDQAIATIEDQTSALALALTNVPSPPGGAWGWCSYSTWR